jgi:ribosomal protein S18 acetylase RimI-like enzyme
MAAGAVEIRQARDAADIASCRELFTEYQRGTGVSLCFQGFERELATLPGDYAPPRGRLFLAVADGKPMGCVAMRALGPRDAEMKRLYVRASAQGSGLGRRLARAAIEAARDLGYETLKLDTLPAMQAAQCLYAALGFRDIAPYNDNPVAGVRFMALDLREAAA